MAFRHEHLSYSRLSKWEQCPLAFRFAYVDRLPGEPALPLRFGRLVHAALERLYADVVAEERVSAFGRPPILEQFDSLGLEDFQQELEAHFVDESYSFYPYELILPCTSDDLTLYEDPTAIPRPEGRLVGGFDVGRTHDRSEFALFEQQGQRFACRMLRSFASVPFAEQEAELRHLLMALPIARVSIDRSGIGMHLAENLGRDFPQVVGEAFSNESKERWATDFKILLQHRGVTLPRDREVVAQVHSIKRRVLPSGKVTFDAERTTRGGHADKFWAIALACQKERASTRRPAGTIGVRILGGLRRPEEPIVAAGDALVVEEQRRT